MPFTKPLFSLLVAALAVPTLGCAQDVAPRDIVAHIVDAYGGREALDRVAEFAMNGTIVAHSRAGERGTVSRTYRRPDQLLVDVQYERRREIRMFAADSAWRGSSPSEAQLVTGPLRDAVILQTARVGVPWILLDAEREYSWTPAPHVEGNAAGVLATPIREGLELRLFVDNDYRVVRSQGILAMGNQPMTFETAYDDFRDHEGVLFPYAEETFAGGVHTASIRVIHIRTNPDAR